MAIQRPQIFYSTTLTQALTLNGSETEIYVSTLPVETTGYVDINARNFDKRELCKYTGVSSVGGDHLTGVTRGLSFSAVTGVAISDARVASNCFRHGVGDSVEISPGRYEQLVADIISGLTGFPNDVSMGSNKLTTLAAPTVNTDAATKGYVDGVAIAGAPDASTTVKGIVKLSAAPTLSTNPIAVGTNDVSVTATNNLIPRANGSGKIASGWIDSIDVLPANFKLNGTALTGTAALLNTATSNIVDLTDGGISTAHTHLTETTKTVPASQAFASTAAGNTFNSANSLAVTMQFADGVDDQAAFSCAVPTNASILAAVEVIYFRRATGNLFLRFDTSRIIGGGGATVTDTTDVLTAYAATDSGASPEASGIITVPPNAYSAVVSVTGGDIICINIERDASVGTDTYNATWEVFGVRFTFA